MANPRAPVNASANPADYTENAKDVETTRSITGLLAVVVGDVAIAVAAIIALYEVAANTTSSSAVVSILTSAFTAIGTMTTAYFGIRAASNTAQSSTLAASGRGAPSRGDQSPGAEHQSGEAAGPESPGHESTGGGTPAG